MKALGTPACAHLFSHVPGTIAAGDCDPIKNGMQTGPPKWGGVRIFDSMAQENVVQLLRLHQRAGHAIRDGGKLRLLGFIRSWGWADHLTFAGTHLRMCYGRNAS